MKDSVRKFRDSGKHISSKDIIEVSEALKTKLIVAWHNSPSQDREGREDLYRQVKGIDAVINMVVAEWSNK